METPLDNLEGFLDILKIKIQKGEIKEEILKKIGELKMLYTFDKDFKEADKETEKYMKYFITGWYIHTQLLAEAEK
jgi:hypothetical protein